MQQVTVSGFDGVRTLGCQPNELDRRDLSWTFRLPTIPVLEKLPQKVDMRPRFKGRIRDQLDKGSCVPHAALYCHEYAQRWQEETKLMSDGQPFRYQMVQGNPTRDSEELSRLMLYWQVRREEGTLPIDSGCQIRTACHVLRKQGTCDERLWPYDVLNWKKTPPDHCFEEAQDHQLLQYGRVGMAAFSEENVIASLEAALSTKIPVMGGIMLFESFLSKEVSAHGDVPMPKDSEAPLGGHAVTFVGYDRKRRKFLMLNSWGEAWGDEGFFTLPYEYAGNRQLARDFTQLRIVEIVQDELPLDDAPTPRKSESKGRGGNKGRNKQQLPAAA